MTSKENIERLDNAIKEHLSEQCYMIWNSIKKDLEVLEIIKKWSFLDTFYREDTDTTYDRFLCNIHTKGMKEDFEKVKEWLENE